MYKICTVLLIDLYHLHSELVHKDDRVYEISKIKWRCVFLALVTYLFIFLFEIRFTDLNVGIPGTEYLEASTLIG